MKTPCILVTIALIFLTPSRAAEKEPTTKLQTFEAKSGSIIVRGFSKIGTVRGKYGETVSVEARESRDATNSKAAHGIILLAEENGTIAREGTAYVDYDEIDSLLKGIDYISRIDKSATKMENVQADYRTRGDLLLSTYSNSDGKIQAAVTCGAGARFNAHLSLKELADLRQFIVTAKEKLDAVRKE